MTNLLSFPEHRPQPEIHQVSQVHCPDRNPELSHFKPFCSFCLATPSNRGRATYRSGGGHITTIPSIPTPRPANVSRMETMALATSYLLDSLRPYSPLPHHPNPPANRDRPSRSTVPPRPIVSKIGSRQRRRVCQNCFDPVYPAFMKSPLHPRAA